MFSSPSSPYADRSQEKSYKRPNFSHPQSALNFSALSPGNTSQPPLAASQLSSSWSTSFSPQSSLSSSTRDGSGYLPGYLLSASQGMVSTLVVYTCRDHILKTGPSHCQKVLNVTKTHLYCHQKIHPMAVLLWVHLALRMATNTCRFPFSFPSFGINGT